MCNNSTEDTRPVNLAFAFRLEVLKKELDSIDNSIRKIDDIGNSIKNWAILSWTGTVAAILGKPELYCYALVSALPPLIFLLVDAHWRKVQRRLSYRQRLIADFINSKDLDKAFELGQMSFQVLDPVARKSNSHPDFQNYISLRRILKFPTISLIYLGLALLSIGMSALLHFAPPVIR